MHSLEDSPSEPGLYSISGELLLICGAILFDCNEAVNDTSGACRTLSTEASASTSSLGSVMPGLSAWFKTLVASSSEGSTCMESESSRESCGIVFHFGGPRYIGLLCCSLLLFPSLYSSNSISWARFTSKSCFSRKQLLFCEEPKVTTSANPSTLFFRGRWLLILVPTLLVDLCPLETPHNTSAIILFARIEIASFTACPFGLVPNIAAKLGVRTGGVWSTQMVYFFPQPLTFNWGGIVPATIVTLVDRGCEHVHKSDRHIFHRAA